MTPFLSPRIEFWQEFTSLGPGDDMSQSSVFRCTSHSFAWLGHSCKPNATMRGYFGTWRVQLDTCLLSVLLCTCVFGLGYFHLDFEAPSLNRHAQVNIHTRG